MEGWSTVEAGCVGVNSNGIDTGQEVSFISISPVSGNELEGWLIKALIDILTASLGFVSNWNLRSLSSGDQGDTSIFMNTVSYVHLRSNCQAGSLQEPVLNSHS